MWSAAGYFNVYGNAARKDEHDYVIHLGDYMYEYGKEGERATKPTKMLWTLHDYRTRHGLVCTNILNRVTGVRRRRKERRSGENILIRLALQHRSDPDLQLLSQNSAWITTWDDHGTYDCAERRTKESSSCCV